MKLSRSLPLALLCLLPLLIATGCQTTAGQVKKAANFSEKLRNVTVDWKRWEHFTRHVQTITPVPLGAFTVPIRSSNIHPSDRKKGEALIEEALAHFSERGANVMKEQLAASGVQLHSSETEAKTKLVITARWGSANCGGLGCLYGVIGQRVELIDLKSKQTVWSAEFKSEYNKPGDIPPGESAGGTSADDPLSSYGTEEFGAGRTDIVIPFTESVIEQLRESGLL